MEENRKNDIIQDSYYLINLYHENKKIITQLHVQKLMFLFEAFSMNAMEIETLYDCNYKAWDFGPVVPILYKRYKNFGKEDIKLTEEEINLGNQISVEKRVLMQRIYEAFNDFSPLQLVAFTHAKDSPWRNVWETNKYGEISKKEIKQWFKKYVKEQEE